MAKKQRMGRPPLPKGASREGRLYCRMLESEIREIKTAAKKAKKPTSVWIRELLLAAARALNRSLRVQ